MVIQVQLVPFKIGENSFLIQSESALNLQAPFRFMRYTGSGIETLANLPFSFIAGNVAIIGSAPAEQKVRTRKVISSL